VPDERVIGQGADRVINGDRVCGLCQFQAGFSKIKCLEWLGVTLISVCHGGRDLRGLPSSSTTGIAWRLRPA
jgi:hypothetical protein